MVRSLEPEMTAEGMEALGRIVPRGGETAERLKEGGLHTLRGVELEAPHAG
jgi:hypothetical protein